MSPRLSKRLLNAYIDNKLTRHSPLKINTVISNVAGPNFPLYCSGAKLLRYHGLGVLTAGVGIFHLVFTYCDEMTITILADREMMPDPAFYRQCMDESFAELQAAVKKDEQKKLEAAEKLLTTAANSKKEKASSKKAATSSEEKAPAAKAAPKSRKRSASSKTASSQAKVA